jgi:hypothetical protein
VPRKPSKVKDTAELVRVTVMVDGEDVREIDEYAEKATKTDQYGRAITRSDIVRALVKEALRARREKK